MNNFKGWHVLGASFVTAMLMAGATFYSFQHFVTPIEAEFGLARDQVNLGMMAFLLSSAIWANCFASGVWLYGLRTFHRQCFNYELVLQKARTRLGHCRCRNIRGRFFNSAYI